MSEHSKIEWTDATWNPVLGCTAVSAGCANCYAIQSVWRMAHNPNEKIRTANEGLTIRLSNGRIGWTGKVNKLAERLTAPMRWKSPRRIFVNSQSDLFHPDVPDEFIAAVFGVMAACPQHVFQILTKRPERMRAWLEWLDDIAMELRPIGRAPDVVRVCLRASCEYGVEAAAFTQAFKIVDDDGGVWPVKNVWIGTSVETQISAEERIPHLIRIPAVVRFLSCEPLLGPVDLTSIALGGGDFGNCLSHVATDIWSGNGAKSRNWGAIHWVIAGGESGPGARPMHPDWARSLRDQCADAGIPFLYKQWGEYSPTRTVYNEANHAFEDVTSQDGMMYRVGKKAAGRVLDGRTWDEFPKVAVAR